MDYRNELSGNNEQASRARLANVERKLSKDSELKEKYGEIVKEQLAAGIVEKVPEIPTGERTFYMPHKPVIRRRRHHHQSQDGFRCKRKATSSSQ